MMRKMVYWLLGWTVCIWTAGVHADQSTLDPIPDTLPSITPGKEISLAEALQLADQRNLSIAALRTTVLKAEAQLKASWALLLPNASAVVNLTHNDHADVADTSQGSFTIRHQDDFRGNVLISMPLVNLRNWQNISLQATNLDAARLSAELNRQSLLLSVGQAYYQALTARSLIDIHQNQIQSSKRHLTVATVRHRSGTGQRLDVIRAKTELLTAYEELLNAHTGLDNARDALAVLLNLKNLPLPNELPDMQIPAESEKHLLDLASQKREDLKLQRTLVEIADSQLTSSWMQFLPYLAASWQMNYIGDPSSFGSPDQVRWFVGVNLSIPIYDHARYADLDLKRAELQRARLEAQRTELEARADVRKAYRDYLTARSQVTTAKTKSGLGRQSLQLAETSYENGTGSSLEVTDARRSSRAADIDLTVKRFFTQLSLLKLLRAVGCDMRTMSR